MSIESEEFDNALDLLSAILIKGISKHLKQGLSREYIEAQDTLSTLRGRINLRESMYLDMCDDRRISCTFDDFSANHLMNRILKTTSWYLICSDDVKKENRDALKRMYMLHLHEIDVMQPSEINWRGLHYHRNNSTYRMLMDMCYFVLHDLLLTTKDGKYKLAKYLDDRQMSALYEKFILEYYRTHYGEYNPDPRQINWNIDGDDEDRSRHLPNMETDIMLTAYRGAKKLIIDAKYYKKIMQQSQYGSESIRSGHLYQVFAYVKNEDKAQTGNVHGMLLYAKTEEDTPPTKDYMMSGNRIGIRTLDLSTSFPNIRKQLDDIVEEWVKWPQKTTY